jgi:hypothetical protein
MNNKRKRKKKRVGGRLPHNPYLKMAIYRKTSSRGIHTRATLAL